MKIIPVFKRSKIQLSGSQTTIILEIVNSQYVMLK